MTQYTLLELQNIVKNLAQSPFLSFDTETTGLDPYGPAHLFAVVISTDTENFYFDFNHGYQSGPYAPLPLEWVAELTPLFQSGMRFAQNAKFDMHFLNKEGVKFGPECVIACTEVQARLIYNDHRSYKLADIALRYGMEKKGALVDDWIKANNAYEETVDQFGNAEKRPCFERVPFDIMKEYACQDSRITYDIGIRQLRELAEIAESNKVEGKPEFIADGIERAVTPVLFRMERRGIRVNIPYAKEAYYYEENRKEKSQKEITKMIGVPFVDSATALAPIFQALGLPMGKTREGNDSVDADHLTSLKHPVADAVLGYRDALKRSSTYWKNIVNYASFDGFIHPNFRQSGAMTMRMSCTSPNMQNATKEDDSAYPIRKAFIPRDGFCFVEFDFMAQEFRLAVEYGREQRLSANILLGYDPHTAAAEESRISRKDAKILNFMILFGAGAPKIAAALGCTIQEARILKHKYFKGMPGIRRLIYKATDMAEFQKYVVNWAGARYHYPDSKWAYKAANSIIQGGCAHITKKALELVEKQLPPTSHILLAVHDSILIEMPEEDFGCIPAVQEAMVASFQATLMPMGASVEHSFTNWGELVKGAPNVTKS